MKKPQEKTLWALMPHLRKNCCLKMNHSQIAHQTLNWTESWTENQRSCSAVGFAAGLSLTAMKVKAAEASTGASYSSWTVRACSAHCWNWMTEKEASACWS
tara:strand:+ start:541 stop:843 length:303 start_codon:yes stop_codon:yes gene_type:complete